MDERSEYSVGSDSNDSLFEMTRNRFNDGFDDRETCIRSPYPDPAFQRFLSDETSSIRARIFLACNQKERQELELQLLYSVRAHAIRAGDFSPTELVSLELCSDELVPNVSLPRVHDHAQMDSPVFEHFISHQAVLPKPISITTQLEYGGKSIKFGSLEKSGFQSLGSPQGEFREATSSTPKESGDSANLTTTQRSNSVQRISTVTSTGANTIAGPSAVNGGHGSNRKASGRHHQQGRTSRKPSGALYICQLCVQQRRPFTAKKSIRDLIEHLTGPHLMQKRHLMLADPDGEEDWRGICMWCMLIFRNLTQLVDHCKEHERLGEKEHRSELWSIRKLTAINVIFAHRLPVENIVNDFSFIKLANINIPNPPNSPIPSENEIQVASIAPRQYDESVTCDAKPFTIQLDDQQHHRADKTAPSLSDETNLDPQLFSVPSSRTSRTESLTAVDEDMINAFTNLGDKDDAAAESLGWLL